MGGSDEFLFFWCSDCGFCLEFWDSGDGRWAIGIPFWRIRGQNWKYGGLGREHTWDLGRGIACCCASFELVV